MVIYKKAIVYAAREIPDGLTDEQIESENFRLEGDIALDLDNIGNENGCEYFSTQYIYEVDTDNDDYEIAYLNKMMSRKEE